MKAIFSPKGFDCLVSSISGSSHSVEKKKGRRQASISLECAGGVSLAVFRLAALPGSVPVINRHGMLWGKCLAVKPNTRHIWQTVYSLCCIFSTKHGAWPIFSPNWYIPQSGSWYKYELCGTMCIHTFTHTDGTVLPSLVQRVCM